MTILLAISAIQLVQGETLPVKNVDHPGVPDAGEIMAASIAATQHHWETRVRYTYMERDESRRRDQAGRVKSEEVAVSRTILVNGIPFEQLLERNGRPLSAEEKRKQREKFDRLKVETQQQRAERVRKQEEENTSLVRELPKAFDFQLVGDDVVNGRPAYVLQAKPHPGYQPKGKYGTMFCKVVGRLWVDKQDHGWIKVDGQVIEPISIGLFLVRLLPGSRVAMEQTLVDGGIWMPARIEVRAAAKIFFVKSLVIERIMTYSEYKLPQTDAQAITDP